MNLLDEVKGSATIAIAGHERPDGDCIGSCMAAALYIKKAFRDVRVDVFCQELPDSLMKNIPQSESIRCDGKTDIDAYDCFIALDTGKERLAEAEPIFDRAVKTINIDHHISNPGTAMVNLVDPESSSACEVLYGTMDPDLIDADIARCLYIGIVTDTGVFRYSGTSENTMKLAGKLMQYLPDFPDIVREVFFEKTYLQQTVMGRVLSGSRLMLDGRFLAGVITSAEMEELGAGQNDIEGVSAQLMQTAGVEAIAFLCGLSEEQYRVSLRSRNRVNVSDIARSFGGGGHVRASGCTMDGSRDEIIGLIEQKVKEQLENA